MIVRVGDPIAGTVQRRDLLAGRRRFEVKLLLGVTLIPLAVIILIVRFYLQRGPRK
jgi:hypothetical protein